VVQGKPVGALHTHITAQGPYSKGRCYTKTVCARWVTSRRGSAATASGISPMPNGASCCAGPTPHRAGSVLSVAARREKGRRLLPPFACIHRRPASSAREVSYSTATIGRTTTIVTRRVILDVLIRRPGPLISALPANYRPGRRLAQSWRAKNSTVFLVAIKVGE